MKNITPAYVTDSLQSLGNNSKYDNYPEPVADILEVFEAPEHSCIVVEFVQEHNEFKSSCPKTGQPDAATIKILYSPNQNCIESKSLKVYLQAYGNSKGFGESITAKIAADLQSKLQANWLIVKGDFSPRGGIAWNTFAYEGTIPINDINPLDLALISNFK